MCPGIGASIKNSLLRYKNRPCRERKHRSGGEKQKGSRGIRRGQGYRLVFQFPIRRVHRENNNSELSAGKVIYMLLSHSLTGEIINVTTFSFSYRNNRNN
uniref:Uncharacterized protein n=1 Tax=Shigella sonnei TaxID=624 RepID=A0A896Z879_SHISO|nr:hypothetical protein NOOHOHFM_00004 [Shigella sonnei]